jgi:hypothetical protein
VDALKGRGPESVRRVSRDAKVVPTPEFNAQRNIQVYGLTQTII